VSNESGKLYVVATPIGNLQDLSPRARDILDSVDLILAEDTRHSRKLLRQFSIDTPLQSCHEHNEDKLLTDILGKLHGGSDIALISDAGTPLISDPGYRLVNAAHDYAIQVIPVPGPSACISALSVSGLPTDQFIFYGYLPARQMARIKVLDGLRDQGATLIFYEAPHRIRATLQDAIDCFGGDHPATLAREMTKLYEEIHRSDLNGCLDWLNQKPERCRGEFVLLIAGCEQGGVDDAEAQRILKILLAELPRNKAAELTAKITGKKKNDLYKMSLDPDK